MKKNLLIWLVMVLCVIACNQNEISRYHSKPRLDFLQNEYFSFTDKDYVAGLNGEDAFKEFGVNTQLLGDRLETPLNYCIKWVKDTVSGLNTEVLLQDIYVFPADTISTLTKFRIKRPAEVGKNFVMNLTFDNKNENHQFETGRLEYSVCQVRVNLSIKPADWGVKCHWGTYSNNKYLFMMDHFKKVYDDTPQTDENLNWIAEQYKEYRKTNPPLMDDEKEPVEITFPVK